MSYSTLIIGLRWSIHPENKEVTMFHLIFTSSLKRCLVEHFEKISVPYKLRQSHSLRSGRDSHQCDVYSGRLLSCVPGSPGCRNRIDRVKLVDHARSIPTVCMARD